MRAAPLRRLATFLLPGLALLVLATVAGLLWLPRADQAQAQAGQTVPSDWSLIPGGIEPGDSFRLLFVTSATRDVSSANIADYNAHAQSAAGNNSSLQSFKGRFTALISTSSVDAKDNTSTTGTGVPIYWLGGDKVADDYADLYDKSWDSVSGKTEAGGGYTGLVWTGGNKMGEKSGQRYAGAAEVRLGDLSDPTLPLSSPTVRASSEAHPLYALSPVISVAEPEPEPTPTPTQTPTPTPTPEPEPSDGLPAIASGPVIASSPQSGETYGKGEAVEVSVTFSEAVTVTGQPYVRLGVGERGRRARYSGADGATLTFAYTVRGNDRDENGVSVPENAVRLNDGTIEDADGNAAGLEHPALTDQSGHQVDGSRKAGPNSPPVFAAGSVTLTVKEDAAVGANVGDPVTATDPDGDALTYDLAGSGAFAIGEDTGQITVQAALDYERRATYLATASVSDGKNAAVSVPVTINIVNVDEPGRVILNTDRPQAGQALTAGVLDPDGDASGASWTWARSADRTAWETIAGETAAAYTPSEDDVGQYLRAAAAYTDPHGPGKTAATTTVNPVAAAQREGQPQTLTGTIVSGTAKTNVADLTIATFSSAVRLTACVGRDCTLTAAGGVRSGVKITSVGITVATNGQIDYDGTRIYGTVLKVGVWIGNTLFRTATITVTPQAPDRPTGLTATGGDGQVTLRWDDQSSDATITKWQYRYYVVRDLGTRPPTAWTDMTGSDRHTTSYTVTGLDNWVVYEFQLRAVAGTLLSVRSDPATGVPVTAVTPGEQKVAQDWAYTPDGLASGDKFRLIFVTDSTTAASSTDISDYNTFAQTAAAKNARLVNKDGNSFSSHFRALASTSAAHAKENTWTTASSVPIYWLGGEKVADDYADFYDGDWDSYAGKTESGKSYTGEVWTGTGNNGRPIGRRDYLGGTQVAFANLSVPSPFARAVGDKTQLKPIYALSPVLVLSGPRGVEPGDFTATPGDRHVALYWVVYWYDDTRAKWQYRQKTGDKDSTNSYGNWRDMPNCGGPDCRDLRVTGLRNGTDYTFQVRAVDKDGDTSAPSEEQTATPSALVKPVAQKVAADWKYIPEGLGPGDRFRLLFSTGPGSPGQQTLCSPWTTDATSPVIGNYNCMVMEAAIRNGSMANFVLEYRALVSTATVDARDNTHSRGTGVPIYWLGGDRAADNYPDFYDGSWDGQARREDGTLAPSRYNQAWTGSKDDGTKDPLYFMGNAGKGVNYGAMHRQRGGGLYQGNGHRSELLPLFALSPVLTVAPAK